MYVIKWCSIGRYLVLILKEDYLLWVANEPRGSSCGSEIYLEKLFRKNTEKRRLHGQSDPSIFINTALLNNCFQNKLHNLPLLNADKN
jgi:hypothetical protein